MAQALPDALSTDNPVFRAYLFYCGVLVLKMMLMTFLTARQRISNKRTVINISPIVLPCLQISEVLFELYKATGFTSGKNAFANEEDAKKLKVKVRVDENVERVRRAHLNDLENIPLFFVAAFVYTLTDPSEYLAKTLFLAYTVARIAHTFVYAVFVIPQPARGISFGVAFLITGYMVIKGLIHFA